MEEIYIKSIIRRFADNTCNEHELRFLFQSMKNEEVLQWMSDIMDDAIYESEDSPPDLTPNRTIQQFADLEARMCNRLFERFFSNAVAGKQGLTDKAHHAENYQTE
ncbi:hypothetical protein [Dyadobacter sandarakinus]|uniref:Uncharacterized protein n=1 Tax=Dyadobacter sandarakinus TaxID=2747268 RepID=A0ABX7I562_9BACT|nr:hypothetical protein [Dyadobacter sandarakinus]QRR01217.1 hypothetical protein HWI92_10020 [Dyadobacter sandarakinus]